MTTWNNSRTYSVQTHKHTHTHTYTHIRIHANYSEFPLKLFPAASSASIDIGIVIHPSIHPHFLPFVLCFWVIRYDFYFSGSSSSSLLPLRLVLVIGNYRQSHSQTHVRKYDAKLNYSRYTSIVRQQQQQLAL